MSTKISTSVNIAGVELKNPVMTASGTFGSGAEYSEFVDLSKLGAVVTKGVANVPWPGNPTPRVEEAVSYTHLRAHETDSYLVCRLLLEKKKTHNSHLKIKLTRASCEQNNK